MMLISKGSVCIEVPGVGTTAGQHIVQNRFSTSAAEGRMNAQNVLFVCSTIFHRFAGSEERLAPLISTNPYDRLKRL